MAKKDKVAIRQRQANHFQDILNDANEVAADPDSTPEEVAEAQQTVADMNKNLQRLNAKYGVSPQ